MTSHLTSHSSACCQDHHPGFLSPPKPTKPVFQVPLRWRGRKERSAD